KNHNQTKPRSQFDKEYAVCDTSGNCTVNESIHQQGGPTQKNSCSVTDGSCDISLFVVPGESGPFVDKCNGGGDTDITCFPPVGECAPTSPAPALQPPPIDLSA